MTKLLRHIIQMGMLTLVPSSGFINYNCWPKGQGAELLLWLLLCRIKYDSQNQTMNHSNHNT